MLNFAFIYYSQLCLTFFLRPKSVISAAICIEINTKICFIEILDKSLTTHNVSDNAKEPEVWKKCVIRVCFIVVYLTCTVWNLMQMLLHIAKQNSIPLRHAYSYCFVAIMKCFNPTKEMFTGWGLISLQLVDFHNCL